MGAVDRLDFGPVGIIDIGSNSVRLVVYGGCERVPSILFNEKVMAGLGRGLSDHGLMDEEAMTMALDALTRFRMIARKMRVKRLRTVATAAVRDAANGADFLYAVRKLGLKPALLSGEQEAVASAYGVLSAIPDARGVVADLGGGSLELAGVGGGVVGNVVSLLIGVLRVGDPPDTGLIARTLDEAFAGDPLENAARGEGLYLVGGSFRAIAQLDMREADHPLPIVHQHRIAPDRLDELAQMVGDWGIDRLKSKGRISSQRAPHLPAAIAVLRMLHDRLEPARIVSSSYGLREGLLYADLSAARRDEDPLLAAALEVARRLGRFGERGALLDHWLAPLFSDEKKGRARLRLAACLLGDIAWNAHPDYRAERAVDLALHGDWVAIGARGRAMIARALFTAFGGGGSFDPSAASLLSEEEAARAEAWGRAIRLGQRLSGGVESLIRKSGLQRRDGRALLTLPEKQRALYGLAVEKRHRQLADAMGLEPALALV